MTSEADPGGINTAESNTGEINTGESSTGEIDAEEINAEEINAVGWTAVGVAWTRARESARADRRKSSRCASSAFGVGCFRTAAGSTRSVRS